MVHACMLRITMYLSKVRVSVYVTFMIEKHSFPLDRVVHPSLVVIACCGGFCRGRSGVHVIEVEQRDKIVFLTAGVAVLSLLFNGTTTGPLVRFLKLDR